jgi:sec-independent protein translocase protein TatA
MISHHLLLFFDISGGELLVIMVVAFLVFGPKKLPEIARKMGRIMNEVKKATNDITREFREETDGIKNEFLSARDEIKTESDKVKQEMSRTKSRIMDQIDQVDKDVKSETPLTEKPAGPTGQEDIPVK